jgi:hypothetical protein
VLLAEAAATKTARLPAVNDCALDATTVIKTPIMTKIFFILF